VQKAERFGFDFALSMIKLHGFGGPSQFWDYNLESFTLMAGLAAVTSRIQLFATCAVLSMPPPIAARMAVTIDSISHGRFGVNIISGWQRREYTQMGIWPGAEHYRRRYDYCAEYVTIMRELWETGRSDFKGDFLQMDDCRCLPLPPPNFRSSAPLRAMPARASPRNMPTTISAVAAASISQLAWRRAWRGSCRRRPTPAAIAAP
jgi:pyrimidine oxygenase